MIQDGSVVESILFVFSTVTSGRKKVNKPGVVFGGEKTPAVQLVAKYWAPELIRLVCLNVKNQWLLKLNANYFVIWIKSMVLLRRTVIPLYGGLKQTNSTYEARDIIWNNWDQVDKVGSTHKTHTSTVAYIAHTRTHIRVYPRTFARLKLGQKMQIHI